MFKGKRAAAPEKTESAVIQQLTRRKFLNYAGGTAALVVAAAGCTREVLSEPNSTNGVVLGSGDIGILNYAYALEQLEAAFYTKVVESQYSGISAMEVALITDVRDHEVAHREFFKTALGDKAIGVLEFDFSSINFGSRDSVLATAKAFEDLGVSAYNGAGRLIQDAGYLTIAGKIVSVEARHAAYFRDLISFGSFSNEVVNAQGLDTSRKPSEVLAIADPYIITEINADDLPTY